MGDIPIIILDIGRYSHYILDNIWIPNIQIREYQQARYSHYDTGYWEIFSIALHLFSHFLSFLALSFVRSRSISLFLDLSVGILAERNSNAVGLWKKLYFNYCLPHRNHIALSHALTLFKQCGGNEPVHRSGPPPRTRNFLTEHLVQFSEKISCTRCSLRKFRVLGGGPDL